MDNGNENIISLCDVRIKEREEKTEREFFEDYYISNTRITDIYQESKQANNY